MGASPYWYVVKHQRDINGALQELRQREFRAGRYNPVIPFPDFPVGPQSPSPGAQHATIEEALEDSDADGTRSILDLMRVAEQPDFFAVTPLHEGIIEDLYGTAEPTRAMVEANMDFLDDVDRGQGVYIVLHKNGRPDEIMFAGFRLIDEPT